MQKVVFSIDGSENVGLRIDKFLSDEISKNSNLSRNKIKELILKGFLTKNNQSLTNPSYKTKLDDTFTLRIPEEKFVVKPQKIPLDIVYEDEDMLVINKQAGIVTHLGSGHNENTLVNALLYRYGIENLSDINGEMRLGIVHRLDKDTTGLMVIAKNNKAHKSLAKQIQEKSLERYYLALVWGVPLPKKGKIEGYIGRSKNNRLKMQLFKNENKGRFSSTNYEVKEIFGNNLISLVECKLDTGRTHQIRAHFSEKGYPLVGDQLYGGNARKFKKDALLNKDTKKLIENFPRQALHSYKIKFKLPSNDKTKKFEIGLPSDFAKIIKSLKE